MHYLQRVFMFVLFCSIIINCSDTPPVNELSYTESAILTHVLGDSSLEQWASVELPAFRNVTLHDSYIGLHLFSASDRINNGVRAEISIDFPFIAEERVIYEWDMMLGEEFASDESQGNRWWIMGQWHDQPNRNLNETWNGFPSHSPPISLTYGTIGGEHFLSLIYGDQESIADELIALTPGTWIHLKLEILWSQTNSGALSLFIDGSTSTHLTRSGSNMLNDFQHYFKVGMYRHPEINTANSIYIGEISITK